MSAWQKDPPDDDGNFWIRFGPKGRGGHTVAFWVPSDDYLSFDGHDWDGLADALAEYPDIEWWPVEIQHPPDE